MKYRKGYKYQLVEDQVVDLPDGFIDIKVPILYGFIRITEQVLIIEKGYAWDGASGIPDVANKQAALVHDALYQLLRVERLYGAKYKDKADLLFKDMCIAEGTPKWLAHCYYLGLKKFGGKASSRRKKIYEA